MKTYTIEIQSFIDLITNSSTECFIICSDETITAVHGLLSVVSGDTEENIRDRFKISLIKPRLESDYYWYLVSLLGKRTDVINNGSNHKEMLEYYETHKNDFPEIKSKYEYETHWVDTHDDDTHCVKLCIECKNQEDEKIVKSVMSVINSIDAGYTYG